MTDAPYKNQPILIVEDTDLVFRLSQGVVTIGRKSGNTIMLGDDLKASRHHATIQWEDGHYMIRDAGSSNGTFVNNRRLSQSLVLQSGDQIRIGDTKFRVKLPLDDTEPDLRPESAAPMPPPARPKAGLHQTDLTIMKVATPLPSNNPYVGPRTFTQQESDRYFGREVEARELLSLVISERLVMYYAQSGAGKSSLINTRLVPLLRAENYDPLPIGRVSGELPEGVTDVDNIYAFNLMLSLDESDGDPQRFTQMTLTDFLTNLTSQDGVLYYYDDAFETDEFEVDDTAEDEAFFEETPHVLIIDQFEEIITTHPERWQEREGFFQQLAQAMSDDPLLWVVLSLREDYVAPLDPYKHLLLNHLRARFYMQRMSYEAALEAVKKPAERFGRPFVSGVAESMVNNLCQIRVHGTKTLGTVETKPGQFIEPVQLQVVCYQLWERLKERPVSSISQQDLTELGNVDEALELFYEQVIDNVIRETNVSEIDLRYWFDNELITETGTKGIVYRGMTHTEGIPNHAVDLLDAKFLLRSEVKAGGTWYELVHDRFVQPILRANQEWRLKQPLLQMAHTWVETERSMTKLLEGQQLMDALKTNWQGLGKEVEEFITASQAAEEEKEEVARRERDHLHQLELDQARQLADAQQKRAEIEAKSAAKLRRRAWWLGIFFAVALLAMALAVRGFFQANQKSAEALAAEQAAVSAKQTADTRLREVEAAQTAEVSAQETAMAGEEALITSYESATAEIEGLQKELDSSLATRQAELEALGTVSAVEIAANQTATAEFVAVSAEDGTIALIPTIAITATPERDYTPPPTDTPATTPTPTLTATPDVNLTATAQALATQLANIKATRQVVCAVSTQGALLDVWGAYQDELGCPRQPQPVKGLFAEQPFEDGFMIWTQDLGLFFVAVGDEFEGKWDVFSQAEVERGQPGCEPSILKSSPDLVQPVLGFGALWCLDETIQELLGYGLTDEVVTDDTNLIHPFDEGFIFRDRQGRTFIFLFEGGVYFREE